MLVASAVCGKTDGKLAMFTIIIPSFNQGPFIRRTIDSILMQSGVRVQVIVSDGGSTDETVGILKSYGERVLWWSARDRGYADAVNKAIPHICGDIVGIQSSDDYYLPDAFRRVKAIFDSAPDVSIVSGGEVSIDLDYRIRFMRTKSGVLDPRVHLRDILPQHATFIKTSLFKKVGGVRTDVDMCADADLWFRALHRGRGVRIPEVLAAYQLHPTQRTATAKTWVPSLERMLAHVRESSEFSDARVVTPHEEHEFIDFCRVYFAKTQGDPRAPQLAREVIVKGIRNYHIRVQAMIAGVAGGAFGSRSARCWFLIRSRLVWPACVGLVTRIAGAAKISVAQRILPLRWTEKIHSIRA